MRTGSGPSCSSMARTWRQRFCSMWGLRWMGYRSPEASMLPSCTRGCAWGADAQLNTLRGSPSFTVGCTGMQVLSVSVTLYPWFVLSHERTGTMCQEVLAMLRLTLFCPARAADPLIQWKDGGLC